MNENNNNHYSDDDMKKLMSFLKEQQQRGREQAEKLLKQLQPGVKHLHTEAFKLMTYRCKSCGFTEVLWNSRDGVTPFCITCPNCGKLDQEHINWRDDIYMPNHIPEKGQRIFIDFPESLKVVTARRRIQSAIGTEFELTPGRHKEALKEIIASFQPGEPYIIRIE